MAERALAHIEKIEWIKPIEGADNIELIGVLGWVCIAKKQEFKVGDKAVYIEIDSKCPENDERFISLYLYILLIHIKLFAHFTFLRRPLICTILTFI